MNVLVFTHLAKDIRLREHIELRFNGDPTPMQLNEVICKAGWFLIAKTPTLLKQDHVQSLLEIGYSGRLFAVKGQAIGAGTSPTSVTVVVAG